MFNRRTVIASGIALGTVKPSTGCLGLFQDPIPTVRASGHLPDGDHIGTVSNAEGLAEQLLVAFENIEVTWEHMTEDVVAVRAAILGHPDAAGASHDEQFYEVDDPDTAGSATFHKLSTDLFAVDEIYRPDKFQVAEPGTSETFEIDVGLWLLFFDKYAENWETEGLAFYSHAEWGTIRFTIENTSEEEPAEPFVSVTGTFYAEIS